MHLIILIRPTVLYKCLRDQINLNVINIGTLIIGYVSFIIYSGVEHKRIMLRRCILFCYFKFFIIFVKLKLKLKET
jgi:hypothetical protein